MTGLLFFEKEMKAQGIWNQTAILTVSDFGRTLTSNGLGTDHAWGGNYFVVGGNVDGGQILGKFPERLNEIESAVNIGRGRILPTTPWESTWFGLSQWLGVPSIDMHTILPNLKNFHPATLFNATTLFGMDLEDVQIRSETRTSTQPTDAKTSSDKQEPEETYNTDSPATIISRAPPSGLKIKSEDAKIMFGKNEDVVLKYIKGKLVVDAKVVEASGSINAKEIFVDGVSLKEFVEKAVIAELQ